MKKILYFYILLNLLSFAVFAQHKRNVGVKDKVSAKSGLKNHNSNKEKQKNRELKILFKPIPEFTVEARNHYIRGLVELKVFFNGNGKIGLVEVITGLPYRLTESAVNAAKRIKFKPKIKNRKSINVIKHIEYIFDFF
jgi:outer membrane biosynthesis protein TonB